MSTKDACAEIQGTPFKDEADAVKRWIHLNGDVQKLDNMGVSAAFL